MARRTDWLSTAMKRGLPRAIASRAPTNSARAADWHGPASGAKRTRPSGWKAVRPSSASLGETSALSQGRPAKRAAAPA
eukprot:4809039-Alexandrium_andersonii.AAC.1